MTREAQRLVENNHNLIYKFLRNHNLEDDWYDVAAIGLCKAANNYNSDKYEFSFKNYHFGLGFRYACFVQCICGKVYKAK